MSPVLPQSIKIYLREHGEPSLGASAWEEGLSHPQLPQTIMEKESEGWMGLGPWWGGAGLVVR